MPIKPENKAKYPNDWKAIRQRILKRAGHMCEFCFVGNYSAIRRNEHGMVEAEKACATYRDARIWAELMRCSGKKSSVAVLTIAHLNHDVEDNRPCNLRALCQRCHNMLDAPHRTKNAVKTRKAKGSA